MGANSLKVRARWARAKVLQFSSVRVGWHYDPYTADHVRDIKSEFPSYPWPPVGHVRVP